MQFYNLLTSSDKKYNTNLFGWGVNAYGTLGEDYLLNGLPQNRSAPTQIDSNDWLMTTAGGNTSAGIKTDGSLWTWGSGDGGGLGNGISHEYLLSPYQLQVDQQYYSWVALSGGRSGVLALRADGTAWMWGNNTGFLAGQLDNITRSNATQIPVAAGRSYTKIAFSAVGGGQAAAIDDLGQLWVWGSNSYAALDGPVTFTARSSPAQVGLSFTKVDMGTYSGAALDHVGRYWAWGDNASGQLGDGTVVQKTSPIFVTQAVTVTSSFTAVSSGMSNTLIIDVTGRLLAAGLGTTGQIGDNTIVGKSVFTAVSASGSSFSFISAGMSTMAAIDINGKLYTWGAGAGYIRGDTTTNNTSSPVQVLVGNSFTAVRMGETQGFAIDNSGRLWGWGANDRTQLGLGTVTAVESSPVIISTDSWISVTSGKSFAVGIKADNTLWIWGDGTAGVYGNSVDTASINTNTWSAPTVAGILSDNSSFTVVAQKNGHAAAITTDGQMWCWGRNDWGQVGDGTLLNRYWPVNIPNPLGYAWTDVITNDTATIALDYAGNIWGWGAQNANTMWPDNISAGGSGVIFSTPRQMGGYGGWKFATNGISNGVAITGNGRLYTWGYNANGQLGDNTTVAKSTYAGIAVGNQSWTAVSIGLYHMLGLDSLGQLWTWGLNSSGQLGDGTSVSKSSPVQVMAGSSFTAISAGSDFSLALTTDKKLWAWGNNNAGQVGDLTVVLKSSPVQVLAGTSFTQMAAGNSNAVALDTLGQLWTWGLGTSGQLGDSTIVSKSSPIHVGTSSFIAVAAAGNTGYAIRVGGGLYGWGLNTSGQIGNVLATNTSSPVAILAASSFAAISARAGGDFAIGKTATGTYLGWGLNTSGQLGDNTVVNKSSPVLLAATQFYNTTSLTWNVGSSGVHVIDGDNNLYGWGACTFAIGSPIGNFWNNANITNGALATTSAPLLGTGNWTFNRLIGGVNNNLFLKTGPAGVAHIVGSNATGQFGLGFVLNNILGAHIRHGGTGAQNWIDGAVGASHVMLIKGPEGTNAGGVLIAVGGNASGQLGDGTIVNKSSPVQIGTSSWTAIAAGGQTTHGILNNVGSLAGSTRGTLYGWGLGTAGQIGDNTILSKSSPVAIPLAITGSATSIASSAETTGASFAAFVASTSGSVYAWGTAAVSTSFYNALGLNDGATKSSPVIVQASMYPIFQKKGSEFGSNLWITTPDTSYTNVGAGHIMAFGYNQYNSLGGEWRSTPVQIPGSWAAVKVGLTGNHIVATDMDSNVWTWGANAAGQLGDGTVVSKSSPIMIAALGSAAAIAAGTVSTISMKTPSGEFTGTGTGVNIGDVANRSAPVAVVPGKKSWAFIAAGFSNFAAIDTNGILYTWGIATTGILGNGATSGTYYWPQRLGGLVSTSSYTSVSVGDGGIMHTIDVTGKLWGWGVATGGILGDNSTTQKNSPVQISAGNSFTFVTNGLAGGMAITNTGLLYGWGTNANAWLGIGTTTSALAPVGVGVWSWTQVASSINHTVAIRSDGRLVAWGLNTSGQLGDGTAVTKSSPVLVSTTSSFAAVAVSSTHTVAIDVAGKVWAWGLNASGQLGDNSIISRSTPVQMTIAGSFTGVGTAQSNSYMIDDTGTLWGVGINTAGQVGDNTVVSRSSPVQVAAGGLSFTSIGLGNGAAAHAAAVDTDGKLYTWGADTTGALGLSTNGTNRSTPQLIASGSSFTAVARGTNITIALTIDGKLFAWGDNSTGALGTTSVISRSSPAQIGAYTGMSFIAAGAQTLYWANNTQRWAVGFGTDGSLGEIVTSPTVASNRSSPITVALTTNQSYLQLMGAGDLTYVTDQRINFARKWGLGTSGQIGDNTAATKSSPVVVSLLFPGNFKSFTAVGIGDNFALANGIDGNLYGWGLNTSYQVVDGGTAVQRSFPTLIQNNTSYVVINPGIVSAQAIDNLGRLWTWGTNAINTWTLGIGQQMSPVQVGTNSWKTVSAGVSHFVAIRTDGTLWAWGTNTVGQLGDNTVVTKSSPVQIGSSSWTAVAAGYDHTVGVRSDGQIFGWGNNNAGQIGDFTLVNKSSPVLLGVNSWVAVNTGYTTVAINQLGQLYNWGSGTNGEIGNVLAANKTPPSISGITKSFSAVGLYTQTTVTQFAIDTLGKLWGWGYNTNGEIGDGTITTKSSPVQIGTSSWVFVTANGSSSGSYGIDAAGRLFAWGIGTSYGLGEPYISISRSSPVQIGYNSTNPTRSWVYVNGKNYNNMGAIDNFGQLFVWGVGTNGNIGDGLAVSRSSPVQVPGSWSMVDVGAVSIATVAIKSDGSLWTWGNNQAGTLGDNTLGSKSSPVQIMAGTSFTAASIYGSHVMAIDTLGRLWGWGANLNGQVGDATIVNKSSPVQIAAGSSFSVVSAGSSHTYAIGVDGKLYGWGANYTTAGAVGDLTVVDKTTPQQIKTGSSFTSVASGNQHGVALDINGYIYGWGLNNAGQVGDSTVANKSSPVQIGSDSWSFVTAGLITSYGIRDGVLYGWGSANGTSWAGNGDGYGEGRSSPVLVKAVSSDLFNPYKTVDNITQMNGPTFIRNSVTPGMIYTLNPSASGAWGNSFIVSSTYPYAIQVAPAEFYSYVFVSSGGTQAAIRNDGTLWAWNGANSTNGGAVGQVSNRLNAQSPQQVAAGSSFTAVYTSLNGLAALTIDGRVMVTGDNAAGQLAQNNASMITNSAALNYPIQIGSTKWKTLVKSPSSYKGIDTLGRLWIWGKPVNGELGTGVAFGEVVSPVQVPGSWSSVAGDTAVIGIKTDGTLWTWGLNTNGQLGDGTTISRSYPYQIGTNNNWIKAETRNGLSAAMNDYGQLFVWGIGTSGQTANNSATSKSSPVQVTIGTPWSNFDLDIGGLTVAAIDNTGRLWGWGRNTEGQLADNTVASRSSPIQMAAGTSFNAVSLGYTYTLAIRDDGVALAWGLGTGATLGDLSIISKSSPVLVATQPGGWASIKAGYSGWHGVDTSGRLWFCGGQYFNYEAGLNTTTATVVSSPVQVPSSFFPSGTSWNSSFICEKYVLPDTTVFVDANNNAIITAAATAAETNYQFQTISGQTIVNNFSPTFVSAPNGRSFTQLAISGNANLSVWAADDIGNVWGWGYNNAGQLGDNTILNRSSPFLVASNGKFKKIVPGTGTLGAIDQSGNLWIGGYGLLLGLGESVNVSRSVPVAVTAGLNSWTSVYAGSSYSAALDSWGRLFTWGLGTSGQLGHISVVSKSSPVMVIARDSALTATPTYAEPTQWADIALGTTTTVGIDKSNRLWYWGFAAYIQEYVNISRSSPVALSTSNRYKLVNAIGVGAVNEFAAIDTTGQLWLWSNGSTAGETGDGSTIARSSPVLVTYSSWSFVGTSMSTKTVLGLTKSPVL